jgi:hypothetical protein
MKSRKRRLEVIEVTLTPQQVVLLWLKNASQAGTFEKSARCSPPHRERIANTVCHSVRESMKGRERCYFYSASDRRE